CYVGTDRQSNGGLGNGQNGVFINDIPGNTVDLNVVSGNQANGVLIQGAKASGNVVSRNVIGTDEDGSTVTGPNGQLLPNRKDGVLIDNAPDNLIGVTLDAKGARAPAGNLISGNRANGVHITGKGATGNQVAANHIGTDRGGGKTFDANMDPLGNAN